MKNFKHKNIENNITFLHFDRVFSRGGKLRGEKGRERNRWEKDRSHMRLYCSNRKGPYTPWGPAQVLRVLHSIQHKPRHFPLVPERPVTLLCFCCLHDPSATCLPPHTLTKGSPEKETH